MDKQHFELDADANSQRLANIQSKYSQVIYSGGQIANQTQDVNNDIVNQENQESPINLQYRNCYSRFAFFNAFYGVYNLILLVIKLIFNQDGLTIALLILSYVLWAVAFNIALKAYKEQNQQKLIVYLCLIFIAGLIETFTQTEILQAVNDLWFFTFIFAIFWIITMILLVILFVYCKKLKALMIEIQYLKLQQLQQTQDNLKLQQ